ncbi:MAG: hypothetical protein RIC55_20475 [Pirellulaceae bacterium]
MFKTDTRPTASCRIVHVGRLMLTVLRRLVLIAAGTIALVPLAPVILLMHLVRFLHEFSAANSTGDADAEAFFRQPERDSATFASVACKADAKVA